MGANQTFGRRCFLKFRNNGNAFFGLCLNGPTKAAGLVLARPLLQIPDIRSCAPIRDTPANTGNDLVQTVGHKVLTIIRETGLSPL